MTWAKHDDGAPLHPKMLDAGPEACWLWYAGIAFANRAHTNGTIARRFLAALYPGHWTPERLDELAATLVRVRLWDALPDGSGWAIHNYARYQEEATKEAVEIRRAYERDRKAAQRAKKKPLEVVRDNVPDMSRGTFAGHDTGTGAGQPDGTPPGVGDGAAKSQGNPGVEEPDLRQLSQPPDPSRPDPTRPVSPTGDTPPTPSPGVGAGGAPRAPTVERQGFRAEELAATLRTRAAGKVLAAGTDIRVLRDLQQAMDGCARPPLAAGREAYDTLADWYAAGSQGWRTGKPLGLVELAKAGTLAEHLEQALAWAAAGRPSITTTARPKSVRAPVAPVSDWPGYDRDKTRREAL